MSKGVQEGLQERGGRASGAAAGTKSTAVTRPGDSSSVAPRGGGIPIPAGLRALGRYAASVGSRYAPRVSLGSRARALEDRVLAELDERLQRARTGGGAASKGTAGEVQRTFVVPVHEPPERQLTALLDMAERQNAPEARSFLFAAMLRELVPDEARLLQRLSDGRPRLAAHLVATTRFGRDTTRAVSFLGPLGEDAGLGLPSMTAYYLEHLMALGLVDEVEAAEAEKDPRIGLARIKASAAAREAVAAIQADGLQARFEATAVALSRLGSELWEQCRPGAGAQPA